MLAVTDFTGASQALAATTLRAVIGDIPLDDVLAKREEINNVLRTKLDEVTHRWGVKITSVEIREIVPPRDIQEAMNRQMSAERNRRAVITESEGARQSAINVAEGDKQSNILRAEGERQAQILRAEGFSNALRTIFSAAEGIDQKTMALQYLDALKALAAGSSTKWIVPMELAELTRPISGAMQQARASANSGDGGGVFVSADGSARTKLPLPWWLSIRPSLRSSLSAIRTTVMDTSYSCIRSAIDGS